MVDINFSQLMNLKEVSEVLRISRTSVYDLLATGQLESVKIGRSRRVLAADLEAFIRSLKVAQVD
ncbi:helix-turn-helix domain-containing protein [Candidatus Lucifugimonas marina]|uniref:helix-turn-helix domain-containing protein n=1 Tax=Candidatus Lucifugimonas marina TaxID=3038979 RepID=UPI00319E6F19